MKNALNINKTVANQYLNPIIRFWAKPLMILSILLTAMFILAACGGGAAAPASSGGGANPCVGNPFGSTCNSTADQARKAALVQTCLEAGAANTPVCAQAIEAEPCIVDPLGKDTDGTDCSAATEFIAYLPEGDTVADVIDERAKHCNGQTTTPANICTGVLAACDANDPFANAACGKVSGIAGLRTTYCTTGNTIFDLECGTLDGATEVIAGTNKARDDACEASGTDAGAGNNCATRPNIAAACTATTPFANDGCDTAAGIDGFRTTYCTETNIFDVECAAIADEEDTDDIIAGTNAARNTACEKYGTNDGGDDSCATRGNIMTACTEASPFTHPGCLTADESIITNTHRSAFCEKIDVSNGANPFTTGCPEREQLEVAKNDACLDFGDAANDSCKNRANVRSACNANPFATTTEGTAIELCTGMTADSGGETYQARQERMCTTGTEIFHERCDNAVYGMAVVDAARTARASLADTCRELASNSATSYICDNTYINGVDGLTVNACNLDVFATDNDCNTNAAFSAQRISICTTDATSFTAGCMDTIHGDVNDAQARFAAACADTSSQTVGCDARIDGSDANGSTVADCINTNPFETDCVGNDAFGEIRTGICTTGATSFHASCNNDDYDGTNAARISFAEACADTSTQTVGCDTTYINGVSGTTVEACNADPFLADCAAIGSFASAQATLNDLCVATNDPFNAACEITGFANNNDANRDTYCGETALPTEGMTDGVGCFSRKADICTNDAAATYNPFAKLCDDDSGIATARGTFCTTTLVVDVQSNPDCTALEATLCAANPFGTKLGTTADVNCTSGYATERKTLADACREETALPTDTTCTIAINNCNADPF